MAEPLRVRVLATTWDLVPEGVEAPEELARTWSRALADEPLPAAEADGGLGDLADAEGEPTDEQRADVVGPHPYVLRARRGAGADASLEPGTTLLGDDQDGYRIVSGLVIASIGRLAGRRLMLHAAGVSDDEGRVAALVAESGTGKTTAARRLTEADFGYVTDECVAVARDQSVLPFPKPLSFVRDASEPRLKDQRGPDELGLREPAGDLRLSRLVVLTRLKDGAPDDETGAPLPRLEPVELVDAVTALVPQTSAMPRMARPLHRLAGAIAQCGGVQRLVYREIETAAPLLRELLASAPPPRHLDEALADAGVDSLGPSEELRLQGGVAPTGQHLTGLPDSLLVQRAAYTDAIGHGMAIVVMRGTQVLHLDGVGAQAWFAATEPMTLDELVDDARQVFGDHPMAEQLLADAVLTLAGQGALELTTADGSPLPLAPTPTWGQGPTPGAPRLPFGRAGTPPGVASHEGSGLSR